MSSSPLPVKTVFVGEEDKAEVEFLRSKVASLTVVPNDAGPAATASKVVDMRPDVLVLKGSKGVLEIVEAVRKVDAVVFIVVSSWTVVGHAASRQICFNTGVNMVTCLTGTAADEFATALETVHSSLTSGGAYSCPYCDILSQDQPRKRGRVFTSDALWHHMPLYHINMVAPRHRVTCTICGKDVKEAQVHIHNEHRPAAAGPPEDRSLLQFAAFALVVVQRPSDRKFLIVQEYAAQGFWLPGGRVDSGETFDVAAIRETKEEGGIDIKLHGLLNILNIAYEDGFSRMTMVFYATPANDAEASRVKTLPDFESVGSTWATIQEIRDKGGGQLKLRSPAVEQWCGYVADGNPVFPLSMYESAMPKRRQRKPKGGAGAGTGAGAGSGS